MHSSGNDQLAGIYLKLDHSFQEIFGKSWDREGGEAAKVPDRTISDADSTPCGSRSGEEG
jgi:hypothetical protein